MIKYRAKRQYSKQETEQQMKILNDPPHTTCSLPLAELIPEMSSINDGFDENSELPSLWDLDLWEEDELFADIAASRCH